MEPIVRTIHGAYLQTCQILKLPFIVKPHTTLNEKFMIHEGVTISDVEIPHVQYVAIGNGGHRFTTGADGISKPDLVQHLPKHGSLYNHLPFVVRPLDNDLTGAERARYRLRRIEEHNGVRHAVYYLRVLDFTSTIPQMELREISEATISTTPFVPTISDLNPTPPAIDPGMVLTSTGDYIAATAKVHFSMDEWEIAELLSACTIIYGDDRYAIISEIGLCSGVDRTLTGEFNGVTSGYIDSVATQVVSFLSVLHVAKFTNTGFTMTLDIGSVEPLLF